MAPPVNPTSRVAVTGFPLLVAILSLLATVALPPALAAFSSSTTNGTNNFAADSLVAPTGLSSGTITCGTAPTMPAFNNGQDAEYGPPLANGDFTVRTPGGTTVGGFVITVLSVNSPSATVTAGTGGYTLVAATAASSGIKTYVYWHRYNGTQNSTFNVSGATAYGWISLWYKDVKSGEAPIDAFGSQGSNTTTTTVTAPSITTTSQNTLVLQIFTTTPDSSFVLSGNTSPNRISDGNGGRTSMTLNTAVHEVAQSTAATTSSNSATVNSGSNVGFQVALSGAGGSATSVSASWTATTTTWASGHKLERTYLGSSQATTTFTPRTTTSGTDATVTSGGTYVYKLRAYFENWISGAATTSVFVNCGNSMPDGGFEGSTGLAGWTCSGHGTTTTTGITGVVTTDSNSGAKSFSLTPATTSSQAECYRDITITASKAYALRAYVKGTVDFGWRTTGNANPVSASSASTTAWNTVAVNVPSSNTLTTIRVFARAGTNATAFLDDVYIA